MWHECPQCIKEDKKEVLFRSRVPYPVCFLHWLARNPAPARCPRRGEIAQWQST